MSALPPPDAGLEPRGCDPFTAQLLDLITDEPGISTVELADRLNQSKGRTGKYLARLRQSGQLTAMIPKVSNRPYRWTLAGYSSPPVALPPEPIAAKPKPKREPIIAPEPVANDSDSNNGDEEAGFSVATLDSAKLPKGLRGSKPKPQKFWNTLKYNSLS